MMGSDRHRRVFCYEKIEGDYHSHVSVTSGRNGLWQQRGNVGHLRGSDEPLCRHSGARSPDEFDQRDTAVGYVESSEEAVAAILPTPEAGSGRNVILTDQEPFGLRALLCMLMIFQLLPERVKTLVATPIRSATAPFFGSIR